MKRIPIRDHPAETITVRRVLSRTYVDFLMSPDEYTPLSLSGSARLLPRARLATAPVRLTRSGGPPFLPEGGWR